MNPGTQILEAQRNLQIISRDYFIRSYKNIMIFLSVPEECIRSSSDFSEIPSRMLSGTSPGMLPVFFQRILLGISSECCPENHL